MKEVVEDEGFRSPGFRSCPALLSQELVTATEAAKTHALCIGLSAYVRWSAIVSL